MKMLSELECPRCGRAGGLRVTRDVGVGEDAPVECEYCGRQHPGRREPLDSAFDLGE